MSVVWRPPRKLLPFLVLFLCMVSALVVVAQQEEIPAAAPVQSSAVDDTGMTEITADSVKEQPAVAPAVDETQPVAQVAEPAAAETAPAAPAVDAAPAQTQPVEPPAPPAAPETQPAQAVAEPAAPAAPAESSVVAPVAVPAAAVETPAAPAAQTEPATEAAKTSETASATEPTVAVAVAEPAAAPAPAAEEMYYFDMNRANVLVIIITLMAFVTYYTFHAQRGKELFIRRISGLSALEDAVGRATEMGRGVLYIPGIMDMDDIQTIAGVTIMGHVAKKTAEYDTPLYAPMTRSFVMSVAQEVVKIGRASCRERV